MKVGFRENGRGRLRTKKQRANINRELTGQNLAEFQLRL